jgi:hypothetical protein
LQPNPACVPPTVPQALNRYAATPLGQPGVAEAVESSGNILADLTAWTGLAADIGLEIYSQRVVAESGQLVLEGSLSAIGKSLGLSQGKFALGSLEIDRVVLGGVPVARATLRDVGKVIYRGEGQFSLSRSGQVIEVNGIKKVTFRQGLWLSEARALRTVTSVGLAAVLDVGFELYEFGTHTGQWGNPYLTTTQKGFQAGLVISSDLLLAGTLAFYGVAWQVAIPVTLVWAFIADSVFSNIPGASRFYEEERNLQPLN